MSVPLTQITQGLAPVNGTTPTFTPIVADGMNIHPPAELVVTPTDSAYPLSNVLATSSTLPAGLRIPLEDENRVLDIQGRAIGTSPLAKIDLGGGSVLTFDPTTLSARATPYIDPMIADGNLKLYDDSGSSMFTSSDCSMMVEIPQTPIYNGSSVVARVAKQLLETTTLSVSIHRSKSPVRAFGYANPKGFARGTRTIAGTLVMSKMTAEVLYRFLQAELMADLTQDTVYTKLDQIPPVDFTLLFRNEMGYVSTQKLLGVEFVTDGSVVSVQDALMEQQISWMAADFTPMVPLNFDTFFGVSTSLPHSIRKQRTPQDIIKKQNQNILTDTPPTLSPLFSPDTTTVLA